MIEKETFPLVALKGFTYAGRRLETGDPFRAPRKDRQVLAAIRRAKDYVPPADGDTQLSVAAPAPIAPVASAAAVAQTATEADTKDDDAVETAQAGGTYLTRDMQAEPPAAAVNASRRGRRRQTAE